MRRPVPLPLLLALSLNAQTDSASLRVLVTDASDAVVSGARVQLRNTGTSVQAEGATSADGYAVFSPIVRGSYELTVVQAGFT
ncbi:MAG: carboxypeptidase regulatory-like domain-containing protein [Acidobacteria bacterium]|nr:carboxypeptidase regulatory-like domain-containing protein [Acidobacteriota bacterium]